MPRLEPYYALAPENFWLADRLPVQPPSAVLDGFPIGANAELVRQWVLRELIERYHFPGEWLGHRLIPSTQHEFDTFGIMGLSLLTEKGLPFLYVSVQSPGDGDKAHEALCAILLAQEFAGAGISTDGSQSGTKIVRRRFDTHQCDHIADIGVYRPPQSSPASKLLINGIRKDARHLRTLSKRLESLFFEIQSQLRDIDGMHVDEALDELCKVLCLKLFDEANTLNEQPYKFQRGLYGSVEELATAVRTLHYRATSRNAPSPPVPGYQRTRGVVDTRLRLSSPALLKCVEALQCYNIGLSPSDIKERAFQQLLAPAIRSGMGQYFTPQVVVKFMVEVADPKIDESILDPFSGSGQFLSTARAWVRLSSRGHSENELHEFTMGHLHGIEKSDRMVRLARTEMRLHGSDQPDHHNLRCTDALLDFSNYSDLQPGSFDLILTNPPFGSLLGEEAVSQLGDFCLSRGRKRVPLEVLGLERCMQFLRPGGRIGIVLPDGLLANRNLGYVREWLDNHFKLRAIITLPIETFAPFGANIQTSILFARKWKACEERNDDYAVFLARIDNIGYDSAERARGGSEFLEGASRLTSFLQREGW